MTRAAQAMTTPKRGRFRPFRALALVFGMLGVAFGLLAHFASPAPQETDTADVSGYLPDMEIKKREAQHIGAAALQLYVARVRAPLADPNFFIGPIEIGMTYENFLKIIPTPESLKAAQAGVIGVLRTDKGVFTAHFPTAEKDATAFRLSYTQTFRFHTEREITEHLGNLWGKPSTSECTRLSYGNGQDCRYQWWPVNGVRVDAQLRVTNDRLHGRPEITLRVDAADERTEGRRWSVGKVASAAGG
ncbi:MAG: hypothetical protein ABJ388_15695 [Alphaproteobacteria bacterium]